MTQIKLRDVSYGDGSLYIKASYTNQDEIAGQVLEIISTTKLPEHTNLDIVFDNAVMLSSKDALTIYDILIDYLGDFSCTVLGGVGYSLLPVLLKARYVRCYHGSTLRLLSDMNDDWVKLLSTNEVRLDEEFFSTGVLSLSKTNHIVNVELEEALEKFSKSELGMLLELESLTDKDNKELLKKLSE